MKTKQIKQCKPTEHQYQSLNYTTQVQYSQMTVGGVVEPKYKLFCVKCGKVLSV